MSHHTVKKFGICKLFISTILESIYRFNATHESVHMRSYVFDTAFEITDFDGSEPLLEATSFIISLIVMHVIPFAKKN
jgi:hypothetical protein